MGDAGAPGSPARSEDAVDVVLGALHERVREASWALARARDGGLVVERVHGGGLAPGDELTWPADGDGSVAGTTARGTGRYVGAPLVDANGRLDGALCAFAPEGEPPGVREELPVVEAFARLLTDLVRERQGSTHASRRAERAEVEAQFDDLTGVGNRRWWSRLLAQAGTGATVPATVFCIDLDGLKRVNDTLGHDAGDVLIAQAAAAIVGAVRDVDAVARIGGDEFAVLVPGTVGPAAARVLARLEATLARAGVEASVGLACQEHGEPLTETWRRADAAMFASKHERRAPAA